MKPNITLIGMPGAGKSSIGKLLAKKLNYKFIDGDKLIESFTGKLQDFLDKEGDEEFIKIEEKMVLNLNGTNQVFSPGGSCVLSKKAMHHLKKISLIIYLDVPFEIIKDILESTNLNTRGIVGLKKMGLKKLFDFRTLLYKKYAELTIKLENQPFKEIADIIMENIQN